MVRDASWQQPYCPDARTAAGLASLVSKPVGRPFFLDPLLTFRYTGSSAGKSGRCYKRLRTIRAASMAAFDFYGGHKGHFSEAMRMAADPDEGRMAPSHAIFTGMTGYPGEVKG
jgi:hypothetical protein